MYNELVDEFTMEQKTRYRLTGTLFLLSAGYILITLLMGDPVTESVDIPELELDVEQIPDMPSFNEVAPELDVAEVIEKLRNAVDEDGFSTENGTLFGQPVLVPLSSKAKVFSVQAASFKVVNNANNLRDRLRAAGYEAFISSMKNKEGVIIHRVAVGPLLDKQDAEQMRLSIDNEFSLEAQIMELTL
tara:strand:- start:962 stop:1525 length:564 start_codon:yes stop_codon:yes gene_type:complete